MLFFKSVILFFFACHVSKKKINFAGGNFKNKIKYRGNAKLEYFAGDKNLLTQ
jgi:hypothetical protein